MPRFAFAPLIFSLLLPLPGCANSPRIITQPTAGTDFSKYQTYAIKPGNIAYPGTSEAEREAIAQRVQDSIARALESRGLTPQPDEPDLIVTYTAGARQVSGGGVTGVRAPVGVDVRGPAGTGYDEPGAVRAREWDDAAADLESRGRYAEGTLVIDLLDGKTRRLVWRATAEVEVASPRGARLLDSVVDRAFNEVSLGPPAR